MHTQTEEYVRERGVVFSGNRERDNAIAQEPMDIIATIKQISDYHRDGVQVVITNPEDSVRIYEIITDFLHGFNNALDASFNVTVQDRDFFRNLDSLATEVYKIARVYLPKHVGRGGLFDNLDKLGRRKIINRGNERKITMQKEHKPISDSISIKSLEREKTWR